MKKKHNVLDWIAYLLLVIGGLNWGIIGISNDNIVDRLLGNFSHASKAVYLLVGLAAIYVIIRCLFCCKSCSKQGCDSNQSCGTK
jgi:uncharacterized membrane protein YuzA (DUF378 family)